MPRRKLDPKDLNYFEWSREIPADAPTGRWQVEFRTDPKSKDATQGLTFRIEEFLPERLKLDLSSAETRDQARRAAEARRRSRLSLWRAGVGQSLHRAADARRRPASGRCAQGFLLRRSDDRVAEGSEGRRSTTSSTSTASSNTTSSSATPRNRPRRLRRSSPAASTNRADARSRARSSARVWPADTLVGMRPLFDLKDGSDARARAGFEVMRSNANGDLLAGHIKADASARTSRLPLDLRQRKRLAFRLHRPLRELRDARARRRRRARR